MITDPERRATANPLILAIDSAGGSCAAAVARGDEVLAVRHAAMAHGQAEVLLPMVDAAVREAGLRAAALNLVTVTTGPGSFTGIRVGIAAARGIALAADLALIGITSFEATAKAVPNAVPAGGRLLVTIESRRADIYVQLFDSAGDPLWQPAAILPEELPAAVGDADRAALVIAGDAAARAAASFGGCPAPIIAEAPTAPVFGALRVALARWRKGQLSGALAPLYLRPPGVTVTTARHVSGG